MAAETEKERKRMKINACICVRFVRFMRIRPHAFAGGFLWISEITIKFIQVLPFLFFVFVCIINSKASCSYFRAFIIIFSISDLYISGNTILKSFTINIIFFVFELKNKNILRSTIEFIFCSILLINCWHGLVFFKTLVSRTHSNLIQPITCIHQRWRRLTVPMDED